MNNILLYDFCWQFHNVLSAIDILYGSISTTVVIHIEYKQYTFSGQYFTFFIMGKQRPQKKKKVELVFDQKKRQ